MPVERKKGEQQQVKDSSCLFHVNINLGPALRTMLEKKQAVNLCRIIIFLPTVSEQLQFGGYV